MPVRVRPRAVPGLPMRSDEVPFCLRTFDSLRILYLRSPWGDRRGAAAHRAKITAAITQQQAQWPREQKLPGARFSSCETPSWPMPGRLGPSG